MSDPTPQDAPRSSTHTVTIPLGLFHAMAACFYGQGPRAWQTVGAAPRTVEEPAVVPPASPGDEYLKKKQTGFPQGMKVEPLPPTWRQKYPKPSPQDTVDQQDGDVPVQAADAEA